jgi:hypothetical protein
MANEKARSLIDDVIADAVKQLDAKPVDTGTDDLVLWKIPGINGSFDTATLIDEALRRAGKKAAAA